MTLALLPLDIYLIQAFCVLCVLPGSKVQSPWDNLSWIPAMSYLRHHSIPKEFHILMQALDHAA